MPSRTLMAIGQWRLSISVQWLPLDSKEAECKVREALPLHRCSIDGGESGATTVHFKVRRTLFGLPSKSLGFRAAARTLFSLLGKGLASCSFLLALRRF